MGVFKMEEKITLTEEQANRFVKNFCSGDLSGFEELYKILKHKELRQLLL